MTAAVVDQPKQKTKVTVDKTFEHADVLIPVLTGGNTEPPLPPLVGQPGIVWYERGDKLTKPTPALVMRRNPNNGTCDLQIMLGTNSYQKGYGQVRMAKTVRHISDPALVEHPEWRNNDGAWDWFDGVQPENHPVQAAKPAAPATDDMLKGI